MSEKTSYKPNLNFIESFLKNFENSVDKFVTKYNKENKNKDKVLTHDVILALNSFIAMNMCRVMDTELGAEHHENFVEDNIENIKTLIARYKETKKTTSSA